MQNSEFEDIDINNELEFNNGVGDALKQKEEYTFSWKKTAIVLGVSIVAIIMVTFGILEVGKSLLGIPQPMAQNDAINVDVAINLDDAQDENWDVLPEDSPMDNSQDQGIISQPVEKKSAPVSAVKLEPVQSIGGGNKIVESSTQPAKHKVATSSEKQRVIYRVIAGSFSNYNNAQMELKKIRAKGFDGYIWSLTSPQNKVSYKVQVGAFKSVSTAQNLVTKLNQKNIAAFISKH